MSAAVGLAFRLVTLGRLSPIRATSPRSCAAPYSSARRRAIYQTCSFGLNPDRTQPASKPIRSKMIGGMIVHAICSPSRQF